MPGHLPGAGERRVYSRRGPVRQAHLPLQVAGDADQVDASSGVGERGGREEGTREVNKVSVLLDPMRDLCSCSI